MCIFIFEQHNHFPVKKNKSISDDYSFAYSTNSGYNPFQALEALHSESDKENVKIRIAELHYQVKGRNGKPVTIIKNLPEDVDLEELASQLKKFFNTGGTVKDACIILQGGDKRKEISDWLRHRGIESKRVGG